MVEAPKTRRRWFQFGVGTMFVVVMLVGVTMARMPFWTEYEVLAFDIQQNVRVTSGWDVEQWREPHWTQSLWVWKTKRVAVRLVWPGSVLVAFLVWNARSRIATNLRTYRRCFQFGLWSICVAAMIAAVAMAWDWKFVRERRTIQELVSEAGGWSIVESEVGERFVGHKPITTIPFWREWLGDHAVHSIYFPATATDEDVKRWAALFPEAFGYRLDASLYPHAIAANVTPEQP